MNGRMEQIKPERAPSAHPAHHDRSLSTLSLAGTLNPTQRFAKKRQHGQGQAAVAVAQSNLYKKRIFLNLLIGYSFYGTGSFTQNYGHTLFFIAYFKCNSVYYFIKGDYMDIDMLLTLIFGTVMFIFLIIAYLLYRQDQKIKNDCTEKTKGKVVKYSWQSSRAPVVEYMVNDVT